MTSHHELKANRVWCSLQLENVILVSFFDKVLKMKRFSDGTKLRGKSNTSTNAFKLSMEKSLLRRKLSQEFVDFLSVLTLEEIIALKLEISCEHFEGHLYNLPIYKTLFFIVLDSVIKFLFSVTETSAQAAAILGISRMEWMEIVNRFKTFRNNSSK